MNMFSFVETRVFSRLVQEYLSDDEYRALQLYPKNVAGTIPADVLKKIREEIEDGQG